MSERFHKAARDGNLDILREATRRDCNARDEDGMTPTLWASFEGNLEALRLLAGRGGDVDKADNFGNTALHFAAARGHMNCVTFLANFGANLWAMDIDFHTPTELAAMNNREDILRFLDSVVAKEETSNKKGARSMKEKAQKDAKKRSKEFEKLKKKAEKQAKKEHENQKKQREKMAIPESQINIMPHRPSNVLTALKIGNKGAFTGPAGSVSRHFSEIVSSGTATTGGTTNRRTITSNIQKKLNQKKLKNQTGSVQNLGDFKVREVEDGKQSVRSLTGLRRDSEILYVGTYDNQGGGKRGKIADVFETNGELTRSVSEPEFLHNPDSGFGEEVLLHEPASMFDRPGFGSVVFRNSITATLSALPKVDKEDKDSAVASSDARGGSGNEDCSIGSAGSLAHRNGALPWDSEDVESDEGSDAEWSPLQLFLVSAGLGEYVTRFVNEEIDLEALVLLTDKDFEKMGIPIGPKRKLMAAIERRKAALADPGEVADSRL
ncbi:pre-mRNA splicing regulator USH1G [Bacillus rossius redtenbacheri]|uniref:pre-mRNA splicing regulator USH1G n=1 Tax=Bacillus rossius redtenbacheri TaxID=93214 RepID=UPI002FDD33AB